MEMENNPAENKKKEDEILKDIKNLIDETGDSDTIIDIVYRSQKQVNEFFEKRTKETSALSR